MIQAYNTGASSYNSLQVSLNHQFARNFVGQFNYTWSHCIDDGSFASSLEEFAQLVVDRYNEAYSYGACTFDIRNNVSANVLYSLPFKGNRLVEGWRSVDRRYSLWPAVERLHNSGSKPIPRTWGPSGVHKQITPSRPAAIQTTS